MEMQPTTEGTKTMTDALLYVDAESLEDSSTETLQAALEELRSYTDSESEELASYITDELWSRGEQDFLA
jgi:hypothetical protein